MIINQIAKGGGDENPTAGPNDVIFYDYDGTIRYSYSVDEFLALTEMPPNPKHEGLTSQGWGWTLADAKAHVRLYEDGGFVQYYEPTDGATWIDIGFMNAGNLYVSFGLWVRRAYGVSGGIRVDWGDGSSVETYNEGTNTSISHRYSSPGYYRIKLTNTQPGIFANMTWTGNYNVFAVFASSHCNFGTYTFYAARYASEFCYSVQRVYANAIPDQCFIYTNAMDFLYYWTDCNSIGTMICYQSSAYQSNIRVAVLPKKAKSIGNRSFYNNSFLYKVYLPDDLQTIEYSVFMNCDQLYDVRIPQNVTTISTTAFSGCTALRKLWFFPTAPATVGSVNAWTSLNAACVVYVPFSALAAYLTATNYPDPATYTYVGFANYESGVTLPTQDSTQAYNVTWYASKEDAAAQTNPITVGNGKRVYCRYTAV